MDFRDYFDCSQSIHDYNYTHKAVQNLQRLTGTAEFQHADAKTICYHIINKTEIVIFHDYLKRYLYQRSALRKPFHLVSDDEYGEIITSSFVETQTPRSFNPNTVRRWSRVLSSWLNAKTVPRDTIFLLGFGLRMPPGDVSEFLVKVLKTEDFNFSDPRETILWYCYKNGFSYSKANALMTKFENETHESDYGEPFIHSVNEIKTEEQLFRYLHRNSQNDTFNRNIQDAYSAFDKLLEQTKNIISELYETSDYVNPDQNDTKTNHDRITLTAVEMVLNSGVPHRRNGNYVAERLSLLYPYIKNARLTRQHMHLIQRRRCTVKRNDIILLQFFNYSYEMQNAAPCERFKRFVDSTNDILKRCGMLELYPVNPFESFLLLCLLSDEPFDLYTDVMEYSYNQTSPA
ncbi:MAG TPA: hypothetical protein DDX51_04740 [Clostridiales bacterium]|nr:hypothetical protein [Clostridiales bacterium]